uniref:Phage tail collar domain-containing protein n=1 Tax=viral metagenome TaxID=1070528 RepID=A0A6C0JLV8_9ZZZZ
MSLSSGFNYNSTSILNNLNLTPVGCVASYLGSSDPIGWVICDGQIRTDNSDGKYNNLAAMGIGTGGSGTSNYTPPDYRGYFLRGNNKGTASSAGTSTPASNAGNNLQSQTYSIKNHTHSTTVNTGYASYTPDTEHRHKFRTWNDDFNCKGDPNKPAFDGCRDHDQCTKPWDQFIFSSKTNVADPGHNHSYSSGDSKPSFGVNTSSDCAPYNFNINWILKY